MTASTTIGGAPLVVGLGGTLRANSSTERALRYCLESVEQQGGRTTFFSGPDLDLPMYAPHELERTPKALELVGALRYAQKRYADAAAAYQKAGELSHRPQFAIAEYESRSQGKLAQPEAPLEKYLSTSPTEPSTRVVLAQAQQGRGDRAGAAHSYELVLTNQPKNAVALNNRGNTFIKMRRHNDALEKILAGHEERLRILEDDRRRPDTSSDGQVSN